MNANRRPSRAASAVLAAKRDRREDTASGCREDDPLRNDCRARAATWCSLIARHLLGWERITDAELQLLLAHFERESVR